jgi:hypothetical protein
MNNNNFQQLEKDFEVFWNYAKNLGIDIYCNCGSKFWKDKTSFGRRNTRCSYSRETFNLIHIIKNHVLTDEENDIIFQGVRKNYREFYSELLDPEVKSVRKRDNEYFDIPLSLRRRIEEHRASQQNHDNGNSLTEEPLDEIEPDNVSSHSNEDKTVEESYMDHLVGSDNPDKYSYKFNSKHPINKNEYCTMWAVGMIFDSTNAFMAYLEDKTRYRYMIKTAFLIAQNVVEIHIKKSDKKNFLLDMDNIKDFNFVTANIDRVVDFLLTDLASFEFLQRTEYHRAYTKQSNKYFYNYLF